MDETFPSGWEISSNNYLVSNETANDDDDVFQSLDLDLESSGEKVCCISHNQPTNKKND